MAKIIKDIVGKIGKKKSREDFREKAKSILHTKRISHQGCDERNRLGI